MTLPAPQRFIFCPISKISFKNRHNRIAGTRRDHPAAINPNPLGYSCADIVREVGAGVGEFQVGGQSNLSSRRTKFRICSDA